MSSEDCSSYCSCCEQCSDCTCTCQSQCQSQCQSRCESQSESQYECSLSESSLEDEDIDYTNHFRESTDRQLFHLDLIDDKITEESQTKKDEPKTKTSESHLGTKNDRLRSSYTRLTSWVFNSKIKSKLKFKNKSFKKKSSKNKTKPEEIGNNSGDYPRIVVSDCDPNQTNSMNRNKLFDLIKDNHQNNGQKVDNQFILMYLMTPNESQNDCLIYSHPKQETEDSINPILLKLKGMFITLSNIVSQMTNQLINLSSVAVNDGNNEQIYEIGFIHESDGLLVLALPQNRFTDIEVEAIIKTIARVIKFIYNSLSFAFENQSNHSNLTTIFSVLEYILSKDMKNSTIDSIFLNTIKRLLIDDQLIANLNDALTKYEAIDWLSDDSTFDIRQQNSSPFIVIGSCLLYKGFLLTSHLSSNQLKDFYSFLSLKGLLSLHKTNAIRLVFWSQVFPSFDRTDDSYDYNESEDNKYFVSIVGFRHLIHCTLLEMPFISSNEAVVKAINVVINDSTYLLRSHFTKSGIIDEIDDSFNCQQMAIEVMFEKKKKQKRYKSLTSLKNMLTLSSSTSQLKLSHHSINSSLSSIDNLSHSRSSPSLQFSAISRTPSNLSQTTSKDTSLLTCSPNNCVYLQNNSKLPENLICYLDIEEGQQVFAGPLLQWQKNICEKIFKKFAECCYGMSRQFAKSVDSCHEMGKTFQMRISSNSLSPNKLKAKKFKNEIHLFNVIGRHDRNIEFYACLKTNGCDLVPIDFDIEDFIYTIRMQRRIR